MTPKQQRFVDEYCISRNAASAARRAGYSERSAFSIGHENLNKPEIAAAIQAREAATAAELEITRATVVSELQGVIELARQQANPMAQIAGWKEIAKLCGFYAPERRTVEVSAPGRALSSKFAAMSDEELLAIAEGATG